MSSHILNFLFIIFIQPSYLTLTNTYYLSPAQVLNIHGNPSAATSTINNWVATETNQQITNLLSPLDAQTKLVLVNAITFKDKWLKPFGVSSNGPFSASYSMMSVYVCKMSMSCGPVSHKHGDIPSLNAQILELPYVGNEVSMFIIRPNNVAGLNYIDNNINLATINNAIAAMTTKQINVFLPKFSLSQNIDLKEHLQAMGMTNVFTSAADLSGIGTGNLYIDFIQHMAIIKVDMEGTEASGATAVGVCYARRRRDTAAAVTFDVDRPFLFFLRHKSSGSILFMGRVTNPQSSCVAGSGKLGRVFERQRTPSVPSKAASEFARGMWHSRDDAGSV